MIFWILKSDIRYDLAIYLENLKIKSMHTNLNC